MKSAEGTSLDSQIWQQLSERVDGQFIPGKTLTDSGKITKQHSVWTIQLDLAPGGGRLQGAAPKIRVRVPYVTTDKFQFRVYKKDWFSIIGKAFGIRSIQTGFPEFDRAFLVKATEHDKAKNLFQSPKLRELLAQHHKADFWLKVRTSIGRAYIRYHMPPNVYMLQYQSLGTSQKFHDVEYLSQLFSLFTEALDQLCIIGSAEERTPPSFIYD